MKRGIDLLGMLPRPVVVERPDDHDRQPVRDVVRVREPVGAGLRRRVRRARVERVLLVHRRGLGGAVHLARGDEDEALDRVPRGSRRAGSASPRRSWSRTRSAPSSIDFSTCDSAAALTITSTSATTSRTSSASRMSPCTNESRSWRHHVGEVLDVARVRERVERDDLVRRVRQQVADEVRRDEAGAAGDEDALCLTRAPPSIVYSGRPSTSRWILPRYSPTSARMNPWMPSTKRTATPPRSGPGKFESVDPVQDAVDARARWPRACRRRRARRRSTGSAAARSRRGRAGRAASAAAASSASVPRARRVLDVDLDDARAAGEDERLRELLPADRAEHRLDRARAGTR